MSPTAQTSAVLAEGVARLLVIALTTKAVPPELERIDEELLDMVALARGRVDVVKLADVLGRLAP